MKTGFDKTAAAYLERIGCVGLTDPTLETLKALQWAHVHHVPYENLDILAGKYLSVDLGDVYEKIVVRKRGGYCFELNGLFAWLLRELGFCVTEYYGRYLDGEPLDMPMRRHRIVRVDLGGEVYICDVGVGVTAPRWPLHFATDVVQTQLQEEYRIVTHPELGYVVQFLHKGQWNRLYSFTTDPQYPIDFEMPNHWCLTHPDSIFKNMTMVFIRTPEGRNTIADKKDENGSVYREFRRFTGQGVQTFVPKTDKEYRQALVSHFGITLSD
jgi:arylamine N-acetyltransferase